MKCLTAETRATVKNKSVTTAFQRTEYIENIHKSPFASQIIQQL